VNNNYYAVPHRFQQGTWVGYTKVGENIVAIGCRFSGIVRPVVRHRGTKFSEHILPLS